ncbi:MAG: MBL fold metallo-hydrolase [Ignavibacteria bacterium]|nr:MBL fold metallo-hydrolase [Ignavibacteria bacterium]
MRFVILYTLSFGFLISVAAKPFESDVIKTKSGNVTITFIGHGSLMLEFKGKVIHVDPFSKLTDYSLLPKADLVLITHEHFDHLDTAALNKIAKETTTIITNKQCVGILQKGIALSNGDTTSFDEIKIKAVPAYNTTPGRDKFHPKGRDNGYIVTFGDRIIYIAGDTEPVPEMKELKNIDIAFLPVNQPYTMTPEQAVEAIRIIKPAIFYPYHFGETKLENLTFLLKGVKGTEIRIRNMK